MFKKSFWTFLVVIGVLFPGHTMAAEDESSECRFSSPIRPPLCHNPKLERDDCVGNVNACFGACADREDVDVRKPILSDRSCVGNGCYILYGLTCMPVQITWRVLTWPLQRSWNCFEDICAELNATTLRLGKMEPRFDLEVTGFCCSKSCNIEKIRSRRGLCECPPFGGFIVREDKGYQEQTPLLNDESIART